MSETYVARPPARAKQSRPATVVTPIAAPAPKKPRVEEKKMAQQVPAAKQQKISLANLRPEHKGTDYYIQVRVMSREALKHVNLKKGGTSEFFGCTLVDSTGRTIRLEAWGKAALKFDGYVEKDDYYNISNMDIQPCTAWDLKKDPNKEFKIAGRENTDIETLEDVNFKAPKIRVEPSIESLRELYTKIEAGDAFNLFNVVGQVVEHSAPKEITSKAGKNYTISKLTIRDHSKHGIVLPIWGVQENTTRYKPGQIITIEGCKLVHKTGNLELDSNYSAAILNVVDQNQPSATEAVNKLIQWAATNPPSSGSFVNLSDVNRSATNGGGFGRHIEKTTAAQLNYWLKQAVKKVEKWVADGLLNRDEKEFPPDLVKELPTGTYALIGEILAVRDTNDKKKATQYQSTILYPACRNVAVHKQYKARVEYNNGTWLCKNKKCGISDEECSYGCLAALDFCDMETVELRTWNLDGLLPADLNLEDLIKEVKIITNGVNAGAEPGEEVNEEDEVVLESEDHTLLNDPLVRNINHHVVNSCKLHQVIVQIIPDLYKGLVFNVQGVSSPKFDDENQYLTNLLQSSE